VCPHGKTTGGRSTRSKASKHMMQWKENGADFFIFIIVLNEELICSSYCSFVFVFFVYLEEVQNWRACEPLFAFFLPVSMGFQRDEVKFDQLDFADSFPC
jgi:hypothetical protein